MRDRFAVLLDAFSSLAIGVQENGRPPLPQIRTLLEQFGWHRARAESSEQSDAVEHLNLFGALLNRYGEAMDRHRLQQEQVADDFNLLDIMQLTTKEVRHSMVLAWLLDHDMTRHGTHAQGNLGFRLFLREFRLPGDYALHKYWVRREVAGNASIVDIEVACPTRFIIHVENKIWSSEGTDQTNREWSDLQRRAEELKVSADDVYALFLTPHGKKPANSNFRAIPWGRIVRVLEAFADQAKPPDVKLFTAHYARALRRFIVIQSTIEGNDVEAIIERS